jgi:hypothetical protein
MNQVGSNIDLAFFDCFYPKDISSGGKDKCDTMIRQIVAAELNSATSGCGYSCIDPALDAADRTCPYA